MTIIIPLDDNSYEYIYCKSYKNSISIELDMEDTNVQKMVIKCSVSGCNIIYK